jgi:hypothetical protein
MSPMPQDVDNDPDFHSSDRLNFFENEAAVDWGCAPVATRA